MNPTTGWRTEKFPIEANLSAILIPPTEASEEKLFSPAKALLVSITNGYLSLTFELKFVFLLSSAISWGINWKYPVLIKNKFSQVKLGKSAFSRFSDEKS